ncbi:MAG: P-type conjugative transfer protein TrbG [Sphingomonadaceae bacterium]|nr:P-type conjugative transfer protein TrbG [Sphingomonadaceae bacterium]
MNRTMHKQMKQMLVAAFLGTAIVAIPAIAQTPAAPDETPALEALTSEPPLIKAPKPTAYKIRPVRKHTKNRASARSVSGGPRIRIEQANDAARIEPRRDGFFNAMQKYAWADGALYQVYAAPGQITDIALQPGERLIGPGPVAAGDTVRWIIGDTVSGVGPAEQVHILVKPTRADLKTNMLINTDRRTYFLELRANASTYMASVSWTYPMDELIAIRSRARAAEEAAPVASGIALPNLSFGYKISGDKPDWRPIRAFDDGVRTFIEFPEKIAQGEMPPVFVLGGNGEGELVNYRVTGRHIIVDRLFAAAELRMGGRKSEQRVRITRDAKEQRR